MTRPTGQDISEADVILVDGMNALWRAIHAQSAGLGVKGAKGWQQTGGVYGFLEAVLSVAYKAPYAQIFICWEGSKANRRRVVEGYKVRVTKDKDKEQMEVLFIAIAKQKKLLSEILPHTSMIEAHSPKWEADDVMATLAASSRRRGLNAVIYSTDEDMFQCLFESDPEPDNSEAWVRQFAKKKTDSVSVWTAKRLLDEKGVHPWQVPHMKGLSGDSSDCYSGVPGVGEKTAAGWLGEHETIEEVILACHEGKVKGKRAVDVIEHCDHALKCFGIAVTRQNVPVVMSSPKPDKDQLREALTELRMHSIAIPRVLKRLT